MNLNARGKQVYDAIAPLLRQGADLNVLVQHVTGLRDLGCTQQETHDALVNLRQTQESEELEDRLLELMDVVVGWCPQADSIWPDVLKT